MTTGQFIARQHVKYYWKVVTSSETRFDDNELDMESKEAFWQYEPLQRDI